MSGKQKYRQLAAALCLVTVMTGCACKTNKAGTEAFSSMSDWDMENTIIYGSNDYTRINPIIDEHGEIYALLFDGLTDHNGQNEIEPRLAESWEYDADSFTYIFHLRDDVSWHDGHRFSAEDVKFTIEQVMNPENESEKAADFEDIVEIEVSDSQTISFRLKAPNAAFLDYMTIPILPKHLLEGENIQESDFFRNPVGTGPYKLESWSMGQAIELVSNKEYFVGAAQIEKIIFKIIPDDSAKALQLKSHEINMAQVTPKDAKSFAEDSVYRCYDMKTSDYRGILYNFANELWQENADIIPAINYAIDRQAIVDAVLLGGGEIAYSPLQRNRYNNESVNNYDYNLEKSKELFVAAGCKRDKDGFWCRDGKRISFTISATSTDKVRIDMAKIAAQQLQEAGLDVKADIPAGGIDWANQECCIIGWGSPFDADDHTYKVFGTGKGANYSGYSNELIDNLLVAARETDDEAKRKEYYCEFQEELSEKPAYTFFCYVDAFYVADSKIIGIDEERILGHHGVGIFWNVCDWYIEA